jgi:inhibitor of KinA sporulation pathway (predicted exonuclease)
MDLTQHRHILVVDLEATCCDNKTIPRDRMETIKIGTVMATVDRFKIVSKFQTSYL